MSPYHILVHVNVHVPVHVEIILFMYVVLTYVEMYGTGKQALTIALVGRS